MRIAVREISRPGKVSYRLFSVPHHMERILDFCLLKRALKEEHIVLIVFRDQKCFPEFTQNVEELKTPAGSSWPSIALYLTKYIASASILGHASRF
jgi:hypothetical protein